MSTVQYKCPNCGGPLQWGAQNQSFCCEYCGSEFSEEQLKIVFSDVENSTVAEEIPEEKTEEFTEGTSLYICNSCGAEIIADNTTAATFCYYCHNPTILQGRLTGEYRPSHVIPFSIERENAIKIFKDWCKARWFLPSDFKSQQQLEKMSGVYIPFWLADCKSDADVTALGKQIRSWTRGDTRYTETKEYSVHRSAIIDFEKIPADGSSKAEDKLMDAIEPFDYNGLKTFSMSYLSGYMAEKYDIGKLDVLPRIRSRIEDASISMLRETMTGYSSVVVTNKRIDLIGTKWTYTLLPVWFMTYKHGGKNYYFAINGQTGKIAGTPPLSHKKALLFSAGIGVLGAILAIFFMLGGVA